MPVLLKANWILEYYSSVQFWMAYNRISKYCLYAFVVWWMKRFPQHTCFVEYKDLF